jgi:putative membrane protein
MLFWLLVIGLILFLVFRRPAYRGYAAGCCHPGHPHGPEGPNGPEGRSARDILDERYAKGEIGDEEYKTKRANLS